jgi:hypothetical protein
MYKEMVMGKKEGRKMREGGPERGRRRFPRELTCLSTGSDMLTTPLSPTLMDCRN